MVSAERIDSILNFWFGDGEDRNKAAKPAQFKKWFMCKPEDDAEITALFAEDL